MFNINKETKIYVACQHGVVSGGMESLHQLVNELNKQGIKAYIYYFNKKKNNNLDVPEKLKKYNIEFVKSIDDNKNNILILPEVETQLLYLYKNIQKCIWWLSLDFYFKSLPKNIAKDNKSVMNIKNKYLRNTTFYLLYQIKKFTRHRFKMLDFKKDKDINKYIHLYNCEYIKEFLISNGIKERNMRYLCGPIDKEYIEKKNIISQKYNIVTYSIAKEYEFYKKIIKCIEDNDNEILFIPIKDMSLKQVKLLLNRSKVYIDFGFFPGPERIPREAVVSFCNIITSNKGSAANKEDILIPDQFKFEMKDENIETISKSILNLIDNYEENLNYYDSYRAKVYEQITRFSNDISLIFKSRNIN